MSKRVLVFCGVSVQRARRVYDTGGIGERVPGLIGLAFFRVFASLMCYHGKMDFCLRILSTAVDIVVDGFAAIASYWSFDYWPSQI